MRLKFLKMNGLGNDFVIFDLRQQADLPYFSVETVQNICDRRNGIGCDQMIVLSSTEGEEDTFMQIYNADGSEVDACGNATRCVAQLILQENTTKNEAHIKTNAGVLVGTSSSAELIQIDMGEPVLEAHKIPLSENIDTTILPIELGTVKNPTAVNMGNPHMVFFVDNVDEVDIPKIGPILENHPLYPERANVSFAQIKDPGYIRLRVWERGAGITGACGTAACATAISANIRGFSQRTVKIELDGGLLTIEWKASDNHVLMTGDANLNFQGEIELDI